MAKATSMALLGLFAATMLATAVNAHPTLKSANPAAESTAAAPMEIRLTFSEGVIAKFSSAEVKDQGGKKITTGKVTTDPKDQKQLIVALLAPLPEGTYTVNWNVVSVDTHRVSGAYSFKVGH
jgi:methionine-rich copper-binding protein CopC